MLLRSAATALVALLLTTQAQAHFVFLETDGTEIDMRLSEAPLEASPEELQKLAAPMTVKQVDGDTITFAHGEESLEATVEAGNANLIYGSLDYGVLDRSSQERGIFMLIYHAKGASSAEEAGKTVGLAVEVIATVDGEDLQIQVLHAGKPAAMAEVTITQEGVDTELEFDADEEGKVTAPLVTEGMVGVRAMVRTDDAGEADGKSYEFTRAYSTLTFRP